MESNKSEVYVQVSALQSGHLTLPDRFFIHPASETARRTVPSLSFLIEHTNPQTKRITRLLFDQGIRNPTSNYPLPIQKHIQNRQPLTTEPDVVQSLSKGGLSPSDIDYVIFSHIHWDHIGDPKAFNTSTFVVGPGTSSLLDGSETRLRGGHSFFESDLLPSDRTIEIPYNPENHKTDSAVPSFSPAWKEYGILPRTIDIFHDGSVLLVDAPGHLPGHLNILARVEEGKFVYLAGDTCHDRRLLRGEKSISEWLDEGGHVCCIHINKEEAEKTIEMVRGLEEQGVEVIFAHDIEWEENPENPERFFH
ncbi:hypothetical protein N7488_010558 [Penicillium malachiteum]|nr:hypothetical protein N7488_010558 [Penicillium malachiteum]